MTEKGPGTITRLLEDVRAGRREAEGPLLEEVYAQLRAMAHKRLAGERADHTLQATALVHEAYLRLMGSSDDGGEVEWKDRGHFYRAAALAMQRILVEHARRKGAVKRGGDCTHLPLDAFEVAANDDPGQILAVDAAILRLQESDPASADLVRMRFFAGLTVEQAAAVLDVSERSVRRDWTYARAKLYRLLEDMT